MDDLLIRSQNVELLPNGLTVHLSDYSYSNEAIDALLFEDNLSSYTDFFSVLHYLDVPFHKIQGDCRTIDHWVTDLAGMELVWVASAERLTAEIMFCFIGVLLLSVSERGGLGNHKYKKGFPSKWFLIQSLFLQGHTYDKDRYVF